MTRNRGGSQSPSAEDWAGLALDLLTYAGHDDGCASNGFGIEHRDCTCGLRDFTQKATAWAEGVATTPVGPREGAQAPNHPNTPDIPNQGEGG